MTDTSNLVAGQDLELQPQCVIGHKYCEDCGPVRVGDHARLRAGAIIYGDVTAGDYFQTGHHVMIREHTTMGDHVVIGTQTVIDGRVTIGDYVKIESQCYIPTHTTIGSRVFFGPGVTLTNDRYPLKQRDQYKPEGPIIEDGVTLGGNVVVCPGVRIGEGSFVAAGAVVTADVPPMSLVVGVPGRVRDLPDHLAERNIALSWMKFLPNEGGVTA
ncbi:MAG: acyltransferase [Phycisphaerales bacterium]|jgi:serine acetyltransferase|nr:acyltransferase [Phycisphaerales bacterium]